MESLLRKGPRPLAAASNLSLFLVAVLTSCFNNPQRSTDSSSFQRRRGEEWQDAVCTPCGCAELGACPAACLFTRAFWTGGKGLCSDTNVKRFAFLSLSRREEAPFWQRPSYCSVSGSLERTNVTVSSSGGCLCRGVTQAAGAVRPGGPGSHKGGGSLLPVFPDSRCAR